MDDYSRHYAILRITHDVDWNGLRARYKRLIGQWHPDRFQADAPDRQIAEEHSKEITLAYQALERYYRDHGVLPDIASPRGRKDAGTTVRPDTAPDSARETPTPPKRASRDAPAPTGRRRLALIVLSSILMASYAAYRYSDQEARPPAAADSDGNVEESAEPVSPARDLPQGGGISAGSTLGEVYAIQGIPTRTEGDVWHYGKSSIRFSQGKVVSWTQHPDSPLRIARDQPVQLREGQFDVGSSKDEVRSIQGTPVTETAAVWDYGPSRVYFENNRVVRWENSPLHPLHVPH